MRKKTLDGGSNIYSVKFTFKSLSAESKIKIIIFFKFQISKISLFITNKMWINTIKKIFNKFLDVYR